MFTRAIRLEFVILAVMNLCTGWVNCVLKEEGNFVGGGDFVRGDCVYMTGLSVSLD